MILNIYDFDGVLCDPIEDTVFRLPENDYDAGFIKLGRERYGITTLSDHVPRNRHLILQEVLYERKMCPAPGPMFDQLDRPFFVLTARAGPGAVARVCQFFEAHNKRPEEMYFVGPVSKNHVLKYLCESHPDHELWFSDDNKFHIENADTLNIPNLKTFFVDNNVPSLTQKAMAFYEEQAIWLGTI
jgi:hypothetical protein